MLNLIALVKFKFFRLNLLIFILFSMSMTIICERIPNNVYQYKKWMFRERKWEDGGRVYEQYFGVKKWKSKLPDISDFMKWRFNKKHLGELNNDYLSLFLIESCKSEFTHWMIILSSVLFFIWSDVITAVLMIIIASFLNLPYIIIQRYNRPRLIKLLKHNNVGNYALTTAKV